MVMRVLLVINCSYPVGPAGANRVQKLARGLQREGAEVSVLAERITPASDEGGGVDDCGIPYREVLPTCHGRVRKLLRLINLRQEYVRKVLQVAESESIDAMILYGSCWAYFQPLLRICREQGIAGVLNLDEWFTIRSSATFNPLFWDRQVMYRRIFPWLDGTISISRHWFEYCQSRGIPTLHIPALSDPDVPAAPSRPPGQPFTMAYLGGLAARDLPGTMLAGVLAGIRRGLDIRLVIIGRVGGSVAARRAMREVAENRVLRNAVVATGWLSASEVQKQLWAADALVLLRSDDWESRACCPTRLPEYLMTGRPALLSAVGDVAYYMRHRQDCWLLPPGDRPEELAAGLQYLAAHREEGGRIGQSGRLTAMRELSYITHGRRLQQFLTGLACRKTVLGNY